MAHTTFSEVEGHSPLSVGPSLGRDVEPEGRSERANDVDEWIQVSDRLEQGRTSLACVEGFSEVDVDVSDLVVSQKRQNDLSCVVSGGGEVFTMTGKGSMRLCWVRERDGSADELSENEDAVVHPRRKASWLRYLEEREPSNLEACKRLELVSA